MNDFFRESLFAGVTLSLLSYFIGSVLKKKFKLGIFNPLLISIIITIIVLAVSGVDYDVYNQPGSDYVINHFKKYIHPGAIPLIHNISKSNAEALDTVLTNLEQEGYTFHSLSDLKKG